MISEPTADKPAESRITLEDYCRDHVDGKAGAFLTEDVLRAKARAAHNAFLDRK